MDPISNKKEFEDLTANLRDLAYSYIEKYSPSKQQTKTYLLKKYLKKFQGSKAKREITEIIDNIISNLEKGRFLNDSLYSDSRARMLFRRGYSLNKINYSLRSKGVDQKNIQLSLEKIKNEESDPDFVSAMKICKKRGSCVVDFGVSHTPEQSNPLDPKFSLIQFKEQFGARGIMRIAYQKELL